jgi:hypothetical protein
MPTTLVSYRGEYGRTFTSRFTLSGMPKAQYPVWVSPSTKRVWSTWPTAVQEETRVACENFVKDPRFGQFWSQTGQSKRAADILSRLLKGAANTLLLQDFEDVLAPARVAELLAWIAYCDDDGDVLWAVKTGLKWLGIERQKKKRGRPVGGKSNIEHQIEFRKWSLLIDHARVLDLKKSMKKDVVRYGDARLRALLKERGWRDEEIDVLIRLKTRRSMAIQLTANSAGVIYDTVQKALRSFESGNIS